MFRHVAKFCKQIPNADNTAICNQAQTANVFSCFLTFESCAFTVGNGSARTAHVMCLECKERKLYLANCHVYINFDPRFNVSKLTIIRFNRFYCKMNVPNDIQVQVDFRGIKRAFVTSEPQSYDELLWLIHSRIKNINISASCLMYENDEGDFVLLAKDANSLAIAVQGPVVRKVDNLSSG